MTEPVIPKKPARKMRHKKARRHVWFKATVQNDHVHVQASAPTKWFRVCAGSSSSSSSPWIIRFLPEVWQAIQIAVQAVPK